MRSRPEAAVAPVPAPLAAANQPPAPVAAPPAPVDDKRLERMERERAAERAEHAHLVAELRAQVEAARVESARLAQLATALGEVRARMVAELRAEAADLVVTAATRIAGEALHLQPELLLAMVEEAVQLLGNELLIHVAPEDEARLRAALGDRPIRVVADPGVRAGCIAEGPAGRLDASLETAVEALRASVLPWTQA